MAKIVGKNSREVYIDGEKLDPAASLAVKNHSPYGFAWGYAGSGPAQLALALLMKYTDRAFALEQHEAFKFQVIAKFDMDKFELKSDDVIKWIKKQRKNG